ncbi:hypothetical protein [Novipirellula artificiosorum]|uniref:hypothetical protein n=1 Tax=Novipirellula artificiosorum TaxID=2528016 RepID=UPI0018CC8A97|nr:hypothetical protein [Novipirellula artificiosorum]
MKTLENCQNLLPRSADGAGSPLRDVHDWVSQFEQFWDEKLDALGEYLDKNKKSKTKKA